jgi:hypothetical protein
MPAGIRHRQVGEIDVDVEKRRSRDVAGEIELPAALRRTELPAAVDDLRPHPGIVSIPANGYNAQWMPRGLVVASVGVVLATAGAAAAALTAWPEATLAGSGTALARTEVPFLAGRLEKVRVTAANGDRVPVRDDHGDLLPARALPQGALLHVDLTVRRPGWAGWLVGRTVERSFDVRTPSVHVRKRVLRIHSGAPVAFRLDAKTAVVSIDGRLHRRSTPTRIVRTGVVATGLRSAGSVEIAAAPRAWEKLTAPVRVSWFPPATKESSRRPRRRRSSHRAKP